MKFTLTPYQRLNLLNQYRILEQLACISGDEDNATVYAQKAQIAAEGYTLEYVEIQADVAPELPEDDARLVWDTLTMYAAIRCAYDRLDAPALKREQIAFRGFDGNEEIELMNYCRFIINDLGRFTELRNGASDFNAHAGRYGKYTAMVNRWNAMGRSYEMTEDEIRALLES